MIQIKNLNRSFGTLRAVDDISFCVQNGSITGFLGPNGAGKTTTLRMMVGYLRPSGGSITIDDKSIYDDPIAASARIGYLPEHNPLYEEMYTYEILKYVAELRRMPQDKFLQRREYVIANCGIRQVLTQRIGTLSKGFRQRVGLAMAILHDPEILILDEPTSGLDPNQILEIRELIRKLGEEKTVILSSHIMQEVQALCDRVIIINQGRIIVDDEIGKLDEYLQDFRVMDLELEGENIDFSEFLSLHPEVETIYMEQNDTLYKIRLKIPPQIDIRGDISRFVADNGWLITSLFTRQKSLEEIFHNLTTQASAPDSKPEPPTEEMQ